MFYEPDKKNHGLPRNPFKALVGPRPIGWISTVGPDGQVNLAPYSYFNAFQTDPPILAIGAGANAEGGAKHTQANIEATGEFVANLATWDLREAMNLSSASVEGDEMALTGLESLPSRLVKPPRVAASPVHLECVHVQSIPLPPNAKGEFSTLVLGRVVGIHIDEAFIKDGFVDTAAMKPLSRLGYLDYAVVEEVFAIERPGVDDERLKVRAASG